MRESIPSHEENISPMPGGSPASVAAARRWHAGTFFFLILLALGLVCLLVMAWSASSAHARTPWRDALIVVSTDPPWDGMKEVWLRELPEASRPVSAPWWDDVVEALSTTGEGRMVLEQMQVDRHEQVIALEVSIEELRPLLEWGRLPAPGAPEVLAGDLARVDRFEVDGLAFEVVGGMKRGVSGFIFSYLLVYDPVYEGLFARSNEARRGWLDPEGIVRLETMEAEDVESAIPEDAEMIGGLTRSSDRVAFGNIAGLVLVLAGSSGVHILMFRRLAMTGCGVLAPVFRASARWPVLFVTFHIAFFGLFVAMATAGAMYPLGNMRLMYLFRHIIQEGSLEYVGRAYESQNIAAAAAATFVNNYLLQTVLLTLGISILVPFSGLVKNVASFALAGFGLAPIWTPMLPVFPFHSITIAVELEAYIVATFAATLWPIYLGRAVWRGRIQEVLAGLSIVGSAALLAGLILALAGLYEAASLILLK